MHSNNETIAVIQSSIHMETGQVYALDYSLRCVTGPEGEALYALRVDMRDQEGTVVECGESAGITGSLDEAKALAAVFADGTVTPLVLLEMIDEWRDVYCPSSLSLVEAC